MPEWVSQAIWWQVYPLGFVGAPPVASSDEPVAHRLSQLEGWLDYAIELGASGLALGPVFAAETHGYDTVDHFRIDPRLGDDADFDTLVSAAHARGLRILLDGVFNHVGRGFAPFQRAITEGPDGERAGWFRLTWAAGWRPGDAEPTAGDFEGHGQLVAFDHREPAVAAYVVEVMNHWLDRGADGWRLDAAYAVQSEFWASVLPRVREAHPDVYIVGEVIHGDYPEIVASSGMDAVTQYELWKATWSALQEQNFYELAWSMKRHNEFLDTFVPFTFIGNHDVTRLASTVTDERHLPHAVVLLFTVGGTPCLYYGDEQGFRGVKEERFGGDDAIRPQMPADPGELSTVGAGLFRVHQELIGIRRRHPWLHRARTAELSLSNTLYAYESTADGERLVVVLNLADDGAVVAGLEVSTVLGGSADIGGDVTVGPHGWAVLR